MKNLSIFLLFLLHSTLSAQQWKFEDTVSYFLTNPAFDKNTEFAIQLRDLDYMPLRPITKELSWRWTAFSSEENYIGYGKEVHLTVPDSGLFDRVYSIYIGSGFKDFNFYDYLKTNPNDTTIKINVYPDCRFSKNHPELQSYLKECDNFFKENKFSNWPAKIDEINIVIKRYFE